VTIITRNDNLQQIYTRLRNQGGDLRHSSSMLCAAVLLAPMHPGSCLHVMRRLLDVVKMLIIFREV